MITSRHIVTKASDDGTFQVGDHIVFYDDGAVGCVEACGWIPAEEMPEAGQGMESEPDEDWMHTQKSYLLLQLDELERSGRR